MEKTAPEIRRVAEHAHPDWDWNKVNVTARSVKPYKYVRERRALGTLTSS